MAESGDGRIKWVSIDLTGLPFGTKRDSRLPPVIRNYLNFSTARPFEIVTVLSEQLLVFRREIGETDWTLVSTLSSPDQQLIGVPKSSTIFIVTPDSIHRSDDSGEQWFQFWPADGPTIQTAITVADGDGYAIVVSGNDGSIWRSSAGGGAWEKTSPPDPDFRHVHQFLVASDNLIGATTGLGALVSSDAGKTFRYENRDLHAARPNSVSLWLGEPLVATVSGIYRHGKNGWEQWSNRASVALVTTDNAIVAGTLEGEVLIGSEPDSLDVQPAPFRDFKSVRFEGVRIPGIRPNSIFSLSFDDSTSKVVAWSSERGGAFLSEGVWNPLDLDTRFLALLEKSAVQSFVMTPDALYLLERSDGDFFRLWRGDALATKWAEVRRFPSASDIKILPISGNSQGLWVVEDGALFWTEDGGESLKPVQGPWKAYRVISIESTPNGPAIFAQTPRRVEVYVLRNVGEKPDYVAHPIIGSGQILANENSIAMDETHVALTSSNAILRGKIPTTTSGISLGASIALAAMLGMLLAAVVFVIARTREQRHEN